MSSTAININDIFFGSEQSKYAGIALFTTIGILCVAILFSSSKIPIEQRIGFVLSILIISIPSVLMSLFELTCIVTGGNSETRWWCWVLAWVISIIIILYCIIIIISMIMSMSSYDTANERVENNIENCKVNKDTANIYANKIMTKYENDVKNNDYLEEQKMHEEQQRQYQMQKKYDEEQHQNQIEDEQKQIQMQQKEQIEQKQQHNQQHQQHQQQQYSESSNNRMQQQSPTQLAQPVHHMGVQPRPKMSEVSAYDYNDSLSSITEVGYESMPKVQEPAKKIPYEEKFYIQGYDNSSDKFQSY
jgi:flagellar biosynthesis GTPase FlhF